MAYYSTKSLEESFDIQIWFASYLMETSSGEAAGSCGPKGRLGIHYYY